LPEILPDGRSAPATNAPSTAPSTVLGVLGVISDTHGLLRPEALAALASVDHILHAGDVGDPAILHALRAIAPVTAIRGNIDTHGPCADLPTTEVFAFAGRHFYAVHSIADLDISPSAAGVAAVVYGHSHKPSIETRNGVLYVNPGSAGPRRFNLPVTVALITVTEVLDARIVSIL
jgi:putative phosphoesterase